MISEAQATAAFHRRRRLVGFGFLAWGVFALLRSIFAARYPILGAWWLHFTAALLICALLVWAFRCTVCGGGIKLDGKTCNKCGRVYR
jgi:hypothetical protein